MTTLLCVLLPLLVGAALAAAVVATIMQHAGKMRELCEHGVEASATVERNELLTGSAVGPFAFVRPRASVQRRVAYRYVDGAGVAHAGLYEPPASDSAAVAALAAGDPFAVVYSSRKPAVSAPKLLVDAFRPVYPERRTEAE